MIDLTNLNHPSISTSDSSKERGVQPGDAVYVQWQDSYGCSSHWSTIDYSTNPKRMVCQSLGWLMYQDEKVIVIIPHLAQDEDLSVNDGCGDMTIPTDAVLEMTFIPNVPKRPQK
jgi:hypothetical protein